MRIGKIASSAEYRMLIFKFRQFLIFSIWKIPGTTKFENFKDFQFAKLKKNSN